MFPLSVDWLGLAVDVSAKALLLAVVAGVLMRLLRVRDTNVRHRVWTAVLLGMLAMPLLVFVTPTVSLPGWMTVRWQPAAAERNATPAPQLADLESAVAEPSFNESRTMQAAVDGSRAFPDQMGTELESAWPLADRESWSPSDGAHLGPETAEQVPAVSRTPAAGVTAGEAADPPWWAESFPAVLATVYGLVAGVLLLRLGAGIVLTNRLVRRSIAIDIDGGQRVRLVVNPRVSVPLTVGVVRPVIVLPAEWSGWSRDKLQAVLAHESAHIRRADWLVMMSAELNRALYWFHPLAWFLRRRLAELAEQNCDDAVLEANADRAAYARYLLEVAASLTTSGNRRRVLRHGVAMARTNGVESRIDAVLDSGRPLARRLGTIGVFSLLAVGIPAVILAAALRPAGDDPADPAAAAEQPAARSTGGETADAAETRQPEERTASPVDAPAAGQSERSDGQPSAGLPGGNESAVPDAQQNDAQTVDAPALRQGRVVGESGEPVAGVDVAIVGVRLRAVRGGDLQTSVEVLAEGKTDPQGRYHLSTPGASSKTHAYVNLIARTEGMGVAWQVLDLDAPASQLPALTLPPEEPIAARLVDIEGEPAAGVRLLVTGVNKRIKEGMIKDGAGYRGGENVPAAWIQPITSDETGRISVRGVPQGCGIFLEVDGSDRFAPQTIALNTGMPEQRGERDGTYRPLVRNAELGQEPVLPLSPAQVFEGIVRFEDTGEPAANARLTIWSSQQQYGSMSLVAGTTDSEGRYRIIPQPGIRFGLTAYPPDGTPYLVRQTPRPGGIDWVAGDRVKQVDMTLPRGVSVRGRVVEQGTGAAVAGATIQYHPVSAQNKNTSNDIVTGWQAIQIAGDEGEFEIAVLPGRGHLVVHGPNGKYVLQQIGSRQLRDGKPGGERNYAHAIHEINPPSDAGPIDVTIELVPGTTVAGRIVDAEGAPVDEALVITRLKISHYSLDWRGYTLPSRGGRFELSGLEPGEEYPVYFLDARRKLGATALLTAGQEQPTIVLEPCGQAQLRLVDGDGQPVGDFYADVEMVVTPGVHRFNGAAMRMGLLAADSDFISNVDRVNYPSLSKSDEQGRLTLPALIPGATYRIVTRHDQTFLVPKEFQVQAGEMSDLGDIVVERPE